MRCGRLAEKLRRTWRRGQATIEYVLMLATIAVLVSAFFTAFNTRIVRWIFAFIGRIVMGK